MDLVKILFRQRDTQRTVFGSFGYRILVGANYSSFASTRLEG